jgi:hypothetical protein
MVAIQEGTYSSSVAKESVCGTACGALLSAVGSWKSRLRGPIEEEAKCVAQISLVSAGQAKQEKKMPEVAVGGLYEQCVWSEHFEFDLFPSSQRLRVQIVEPGKLGRLGAIRAECFLSLCEGRVVDGLEQGCRLIAGDDSTDSDDATGAGCCTYELDLFCPSRGTFLGHCVLQLSLEGGKPPPNGSSPTARNRTFTAVPGDSDAAAAAARAREQRADHLKHMSSLEC